MASDTPETGQAIRRSPHPRTRHALPTMPTDDPIGLGLFGRASHDDESTGTWARPRAAAAALVSFEAASTVPPSSAGTRPNDHASPDTFGAFPSPAARTPYASSSTLATGTPYASAFGPHDAAAATTPHLAGHWLTDPMFAPGTTPGARAAAVVAGGFLLSPTFDARGTIPAPAARTYGARGVSYGPSASATPAPAAVAHGFPSHPHTAPPRSQLDTLPEVAAARPPAVEPPVHHFMAD